jgi:hypothetical protein
VDAGVDGLSVGVGLVVIGSADVGLVGMGDIETGLVTVGLEGTVSVQPANTASSTIAPTSLTLRRYGGPPKTARNSVQQGEFGRAEP